MKAPGYGEDQPRYDDDRLPVVLVLLDGLGDRALPELGGRTPSEAVAAAIATGTVNYDDGITLGPPEPKAQ